MDPAKLLLFATGGLVDAAYLFIVSAGLSLVFGALRVINMAHGSLYMIAALVSVVIAEKLGSGFGFLPALLTAVLAAAAIGAVMELTVLKRVYGHEHLVQLLATYAVALIIGGAARLVFGPNYRTAASPVQGSLTILGYSYSVYWFVMIVAAIAIGAGMYGLLYRTGLGRNIRAAVSDAELLNASGVNVTLLYTTVFVIGAALAGLGGVIVAPSQAVDPTIGDSVLVLAFAISVIGGLGSIVGSAIGALMVGEVISFGLVNPATNAFAIAFVFIIMTLVLTVRPWGLFGRAEA
ncbi:MAG TPA: branched-chain amino acid ABC transporter permease [Candidatus Dormibacteraeota bacterium]|nr:branched-chain amino acid ABC transporter permease [Candidatus Dormibacteraeota bacterium]